MYPGQFLSADMDIVLAIQKLITDSEVILSLNHIQGHPEERKRKDDFTKIELANWECDRDAEEYSILPVSPQQYAPLPGARCVIRIGGEWLSHRPDWSIQTANVLPDLEAYISERLKIPPGIVQTIDTECIGTVRATQEWSKFVRSSKLLFSWLPVGHNWHHYSDMDSNRCPCCGDQDETFFHVLQCADRRMVELKKELLDDIWRAAQDIKLHSLVSETMLNILRSVCNEGQLQRPLSTIVADG